MEGQEINFHVNGKQVFTNISGDLSVLGFLRDAELKHNSTALIQSGV